MDFVETFRQKAKEYGCSQEEIGYIAKLLPLSKGNLVFTFKQFEVFCDYWRQYKGICPGSWGFFVHPKNNGLRLSRCAQTEVYLSLIAISPTFPYYRPSFGPGFIESICEYQDKMHQDKMHQGKLVLLSEDREGHNNNNSYISRLGAEDFSIFIGGGRLYCEEVARPMEDLKELHMRYGLRCSYDEREKILICGSDTWLRLDNW